MTNEQYQELLDYEQQIALKHNEVQEKNIDFLVEKDALYQPNLKKALSPLKFPSSPISPYTLSTEVVSYLKTQNVHISDKLTKSIEDICKVFNFSILANANGSTQSYIYPAQTGLGKSVSLQMYVSLLQEQSSMIVVSKVEEAIEYCKFINKMSRNPLYARCSYTITSENPKNDLRVEKKDLSNYRCIVITHKMFQLINQKVDIDTFKLYKNKKRDLIAIDEKLSFYEQHNFSKYDLIYLKETFSKIILKSKTLENITYNPLKFFLQLEEYFNMLNKTIEDNKKINQEKISVCDGYIESFIKTLNINENIEALHLLLEARKKELLEELKDIGIKDNESFYETIGYKIKSLLRNIKETLISGVYYLQYGREKKLVSVENIINKIGANIVLDATATINNFYNIANRYGGNITYIEANKIRKYENLKIYQAIGYAQSRSAIYKDLKDNDIINNAKLYTSYAQNILSENEDKLLIVCHKKFKRYLISECHNDKVKITHWGNHIGKNEWSDCNKVMIVGWNYLDPVVHINEIVNAVGSTEASLDLIHKNDLVEYENRQIADDLVQAVMRSRARKISTDDLDCKVTEIYMFHNNTPSSNQVLELFNSQFPKSKINSWIPKKSEFFVKKTKVSGKIETIIEYLKDKKKEVMEIDQPEVRKELNIPKQTFSRITKSEEFLEALKSKNFALIEKNGKTNKFILN
ncbi:hypothetical protein CRV03_01520 [Arcobacter sp. F155]|uniref:hypothetical protein n=1 Tax=Arcobacter sp. F155 TaxID=2044512 RepID=UPI00100B6B2A|nr:hypothetical protein [Arcobacter sp. F155]RXJ78735.1 hypothetical protein CRV03_01520 [Arcobacter sp. F155]